MAQPSAVPRPSVALDLDDMRLLVVLADELHFGRAAVRLNLSQPGLSYRVKRMEDSLGYELLLRTKRSVELTAAGAVVLQGAIRVLEQAQRLVDDGQQIARGEVASLRVGFVGTALYGLLPPVVREVRRRYPGLRLVLEEHKTETQVRGLRRGQLDIGLVHLPLAQGSGLATCAVTTDRVGLALPADHRLVDHRVDARRGAGENQGEPDGLDLSQLAGDPFVLFPRELEPQTYDRYVKACVDAGFAPTVAQQATGLQSILGMVAAGVGVAFVASSVAQHMSRSGVVFRPIAGPAPTLTIGPAWLEPVDKPAVLLLRDVIRLVGSSGQLSVKPITTS